MLVRVCSKDGKRFFKAKLVFLVFIYESWPIVEGPYLSRKGDLINRVTCISKTKGFQFRMILY